MLSIRILICGSRNWTDKQVIENYIQTLPKDTIIIQGGCKGADFFAGYFAIKYNLILETYRANWKKFGKAAGPIRNKQMLDEGKPEIVIAFHNNIEQSKGTKDMIRQARERGIPVEIKSSEGIL